MQRSNMNECQQNMQIDQSLLPPLLPGLLTSVMDNCDDDTAKVIITLKLQLALASIEVEKYKTSSSRFEEQCKSLSNELRECVPIEEKDKHRKVREKQTKVGSSLSFTLPSQCLQKVWYENFIHSADKFRRRSNPSEYSKKSSYVSDYSEYSRRNSCDSQNLTHFAQPIIARPGCTAYLELDDNFPKNSEERLLQIISEFMVMVRRLLNCVYGNVPERDKLDNYLVLPTGNGTAICVMSPIPGHPSSEYSALSLCAKLVAWAKSEGCSLRGSLNSGILNTVNDVYDLPVVNGDAIKIAARIMDCALPGQILVSSDTVVSSLENDSKSADGLSFNVDTVKHEVIVRKGLTIMVQAVTCTVSDLFDHDIYVGTVQAPDTKWNLRMKPEELSQDSSGIKAKVLPTDLLKRHKRVAFVGVTHGTLANLFQKVLTSNPDHCWDRINLLFLSDDKLDWVTNGVPIMGEKEEALSTIKAKARTELEALLKDHVRELKFLEYDRPFYCASYWDWDERGGYIHVSPLVWGANPKNCPAMNYNWIAEDPGDAYVSYQDGLSSLLATATPI